MKTRPARQQRRIGSLVERLESCPDPVADFAKETEERQLPKWRSRLERARKLVEYAAVEAERAARRRAGA